MVFLGKPSRAAVTKTVQAAGWGVVIDGDRATAFERAKRAALRQAVEEGVGTLVTAATRVQNFAVIDDFILTQTRGFVRSYSILEKGIDQPYTYKVLLEAVVDLGKLHLQLDALAVLNEGMGNPRILCIGAKGEAYGISGQWLAAGLNEQIQRTRPLFNLIGPARAADLDSAMGLARAKHADILLWAQAEIGQEEAIKIPFSNADLAKSGWRTASCKLNLGVYWVDTGEAITHITETSQASDTDLAAAAARAGAAALDLGADKALVQLARDWQQKFYSGRTLRLIVRGEARLRHLFEVEFSAAKAGVERLYPRNVGPSQTVYDIRASSGAYLLARQVSRMGIAEVDVEVLGVSANVLDLRLSAPVTKEDNKL